MINNTLYRSSEQSASSNLDREELIRLLQRLYPTANLNSLQWKIHDLTSKGILYRIGRGNYSTTKPKDVYLPEITGEAKSIYNDIKEELPFAEIAIAHTSWFNEFMIHQVFKTYWVVEVEKVAVDAVFEYLLEKRREAFVIPEELMANGYTPRADTTIVVKSMISESPLLKVDEIKAPSIEKLLVDCICDPDIYAAQHEERADIFSSAFDKYSVNISKLKRYARRRNRVGELGALIEGARSI